MPALVLWRGDGGHVGGARGARHGAAGWLVVTGVHADI